MKHYTAHYFRKDIHLTIERQILIGKIIDESKWFKIQHSIEYLSSTYEIKNVGNMKNDVELSFDKRIIYFTDLGKGRIIKSGQDVKFIILKSEESAQSLKKEKLSSEYGKYKNGLKNQSIISKLKIWLTIY